MVTPLKNLTTRDVEAIREALPGLRSSAPRLAAALEKVLAPTYVTVGVVADAIGVSDQTVRDWIDKGWLTAEVTPGGHRRIPASVLDGARALARPRPPVREMSDEERRAIIDGLEAPVAESA